MSRFLIDESMPGPLVGMLRASGIDAGDVRNIGLRGAPDAKIFAHAVSIGMAIVTRDLAFGNVLQYPLGSHAGIVVVRFTNNTPMASLVSSVAQALKLLPEADLVGNVVVLSPKKLRVRRKP
jgi:predicted nuclease of predicted toxin-antitoxin system